MTFQIFKKFMLMGIFFLISTVSIHAQEPNMQALIGQSLSKLQQPTPENFLNCVAEMKRIDDMFPDSIQPKFQVVLQSLNFSVMNPHAPETENLMAGAEETIAKMEKMRNANQSDICTLRGFFSWYVSCRILYKTASAIILMSCRTMRKRLNSIQRTNLPNNYSKSFLRV